MKRKISTNDNSSHYVLSNKKQRTLSITESPILTIPFELFLIIADDDIIMYNNFKLTCKTLLELPDKFDFYQQKIVDAGGHIPSCQVIPLMLRFLYRINNYSGINSEYQFEFLEIQADESYGYTYYVDDFYNVVAGSRLVLKIHKQFGFVVSKSGFEVSVIKWSVSGNKGKPVVDLDFLIKGFIYEKYPEKLFNASGSIILTGGDIVYVDFLKSNTFSCDYLRKIFETVYAKIRVPTSEEIEVKLSGFSHTERNLQEINENSSQELNDDNNI